MAIQETRIERSTTGTAMNSRLGKWLPLGACLVLLLGGAATVDAQVPQAAYPLIVDLVDTTGNYGDFILAGTAPPAPPSAGNPLCITLPYGEQYAYTPSITTFDINDFQVDVEFMVNALPTTFHSPVIVGGNLWRFIGIVFDPTGTLGVLYNNSNSTFSSTTIALGVWYHAQLRYEAGTVQLYLDGTFIHDAVIGPLTNGGASEFSITNYGMGRNLNGCIRNLTISNDSTVPVQLMSFRVE